MTIIYYNWEYTLFSDKPTWICTSSNFDKYLKKINIINLRSCRQDPPWRVSSPQQGSARCLCGYLWPATARWLGSYLWGVPPGFHEFGEAVLGKLKAKHDPPIISPYITHHSSSEGKWIELGGRDLFSPQFRFQCHPPLFYGTLSAESTHQIAPGHRSRDGDSHRSASQFLSLAPRDLEFPWISHDANGFSIVETEMPQMCFDIPLHNQFCIAP